MRTRFSFPTSLNTSFLDVAVMLTSEKNAIQVKKQITVRVLLILIVGIFIYLFLAIQSPLGKGGVLGIIWWTIGYFWILILLALPTDSKLVGLNLIIPTIKYSQKENRKVDSRSISPSDKIGSVVGIESILKSNGKVIYSNGEVGFVAEVIGNASVLMFEEDQQVVLTDTRNFYRKLTPNISLIIDSVTESQRVHNQIETLLERKEKMKFNSPALNELIDSQISVLASYVGEEFKSLHQYMVVRAKNDDALYEFSQWLNLQVEKGSGFLTDYRVLDYDDAKDYFKSVYRIEG